MTASLAPRRPAPTPAPGAATVYLHPGQLLVSDEPVTITTILGSCVSVCVRDVARGIAGINHYLLPVGGATAPAASAARYGDHANEALLAHFLEAGSRRRDLEVKVFGGASVLKALAGDDHLGARNATAAFDYLAAAGLACDAHDTGGLRGRKLVYDLASGDVLVRTI